MTKKLKTTKVVESIRDVELLKFARRKYKNYGLAVLEDRAFPDYRDGLNPVNRRILFSAYELGIRSNAKHVKSARIVGDVLGRFHPHGDASVYDALVKMTNTRTAVPTFDGDGNWGTLSGKSAAAMRYTECRLSKFADDIVFNKFYMPAVDYVPNFDGSGREPLLLPTLLPMALLNGRFGIAPGATTNIPVCEFKSVLKTLHLVFSGEELTPKFLYKNLKFRSTYGGHERQVTGEARDARRSVFTSTTGKVTLYSNVEYNAKTNQAVATTFARDTELGKYIAKLSDLAGVQWVRDDSGTTDKYGRLTIQFKPKLTDAQYKKLVDYIDKELSSNENYCLNFTERFIEDSGQSAAKVLPMSLTDMLAAWVTWRIALERKACAYWIKQDEREIRRLDLLIQAVDMIDYIVSLLKNAKLSTDQVYSAYAKKTKVEVEDAKYVLNRPIITLRKLDKASLQAQKKEVLNNKKSLEHRQAKPEPFLAEQVKTWAKLAN